jgi:hypothetical protein
LLPVQAGTSYQRSLQHQADDPEEKHHSEGEAPDAEVAHPCQQLAPEHVVS